MPRKQACPRQSGGGGGHSGGGGGGSPFQPRNPDIGVRIVNNPVNDHIGSSKDLCPFRYRECCYSDYSYVSSLGNQCAPVGQLCSESSSSFGGSARAGRVCGVRNFRQLSNRQRGQASPDEFPWMCLVLDGKNNFIAACAVVPERFDNDVSGGTTKILTAAHKLKSIGLRE